MDPNKGYWQIPFDKESIRLTTFNKPLGRYQFTSLPYGVHSAQEVFQKRINQINQRSVNQNQSFERIKELLVSKKCLAYYDVYTENC